MSWLALRLLALSLLALLLVVPIVHGQDSGLGADTPTPLDQVRGFENEAMQQRYIALLRQLRCLVCQNESLAESNAGLARDLRDVVYTRMQAGATDEEILDFMTDRYGDFVLYRPPLRPATYALWFGPPFLLLIGIAIVIRLVRRGPANGASEELSDAERRRAAELLGQRHNQDES